MKKYNKGEWSELYVLLTLLKDRNIKIYNTTKFYKVLKIYSDYLNNLFYDLKPSNITYNHNEIKISDEQLQYNIDLLYKEIIIGKGTTFAISKLDSFLNECNIKEIKQGDSYKKSDLDLELDTKLGELFFGMSIKSDLGNKATLLNASQATNFIYKINNLQYDIKKINEIATKSKIKDRLKIILEYSDSVEFVSMENKTYMENLIKIDSQLPNILADLILKHYSSSGKSHIKDLSLDEHRIPIEKFLKATALSLVPTKEWNHYKNDIGIITVKKDGSISCFDIFDDKDIMHYLFNNICFDTASSTKNKFGKIIQKEDGNYYINLNLQLRFI